MRGGNYRREADGQLKRLNRQTGEWIPCDEHGVEIEAGEAAADVQVADNFQADDEEGR